MDEKQSFQGRKTNGSKTLNLHRAYRRHVTDYGPCHRIRGEWKNLTNCPCPVPNQESNESLLASKQQFSYKKENK